MSTSKQIADAVRKAIVEPLEARIKELEGEKTEAITIAVEKITMLERTLNENTKLKELVAKIKRVSCGEDQIECDGVYNDSDGMEWIYNFIQKQGGIDEG